MRSAEPLKPEMGRLVEKTWLLSKHVCDETGHFDVLPDANFGVGVVLTETRCRMVLGGPITQQFSPYVGDKEIYWLRFRPGKMPRIADVSPRDLVNNSGMILDQILNVDSDELGERLLAASCVNSRLKILSSLLRQMESTPLCQDRRCRQILEMVDATDGAISVNGLSQEFGLSSRTVRRLLVDQVGLSPKQILVNVRLQRTIAKLNSQVHPVRFSELASECGFTDQSHMIKDFRKLTGRLPSSFHECQSCCV